MKKHKMSMSGNGLMRGRTVCLRPVPDMWAPGRAVNDGGRAYKRWSHVNCKDCLKFKRNK